MQRISKRCPYKQALQRLKNMRRGVSATERRTKSYERRIAAKAKREAYDNAIYEMLAAIEADRPPPGG